MVYGENYNYMSKISYAASGVNYSAIDPIKKFAQTAAKATTRHLKASGYAEVAATRGESAYVWKQGTICMATVIEHLGTKNLVADAMRAITGKTYYDIMAYDTIATIINDLTTVGATALTINAYWAVGESSWLEDAVRMKDLIRGWKKGCDDAGAVWAGGETTSCQGIIEAGTIDLAGSAVGIIKKTGHLAIDEKIKPGDRIVFLKSTGINANGLTLARKVASKLAKGYATTLKNGQTYGEALLKPTNIYAGLIQKLQKQNVAIHYIANITGHGLRKVMRARKPFSYVIEKIFAPQTVFSFIQEQAELSDYDMYETFNMGQDYALFVPAKDVAKTLKIIKQAGFTGINAGYVAKGPKQVVIKEKNIVFKGDTLDLR